MKMHQITVRNIDPSLKKRIATNAQLKRQSINDWVLEAIKKKAGLSVDDTVAGTSLQRFAGALKDENVFGNDFLEDIEEIDESMWK